MTTDGGFEISEKLKAQSEELRKKAEAQETARIEKLISEKLVDFSRSRYEKIKMKYKESLENAKSIRNQNEKDLLEREAIIKKAILEETEKKAEIVRKNIEEGRKKEEEEKKRTEEEKRQKIEQERQQQLEEERKHREEEELRRKEEERLRIEEEQRRIREERELKIGSMLQEAEIHLRDGNYDQALIQTAKALVHDPEHPDALALKKKIKELQSEKQAAEETEKKKLKEGIEKEEIPKPAPVQEIVTSEKPEKKEVSKKAIYTALIGIVLIIVGIFLYRIIPIVFKETPSIAIMPIKSTTGILEDEIIGKGLAKDITLRLSSIKNFTPLGYSSVSYLWENEKDSINKIYKLGFNYILEGTLSRSENQRIIQFKLMDSLQQAIWEHEIIKPENRLFEIPNELCRLLADEFNINIGDEKIAAFRQPSFDNTAYLDYLRAIEMLERKTQLSLNNAQDLLKKATMADNSFAEAFALNGYISTLKIENNWGEIQSEIKIAEEVLNQASDAFPNLSLTKRTRGLLYTFQRKFRSADEELQNAILLAPNSAENYLAIGKFYNSVGKYSDAKDALLKALDFDPFNKEILEWIASTYQLLGNYKEAMTYYDQALFFIVDTSSFIASSVSNAILFDSELQIKYFPRLVNIFEKRISQNSMNYVDMYKLARMYQAMGKNSESIPILNGALKIIEKEIASNPTNPKLEIYRALVNTRLGKFSVAKKIVNNTLERNPNDFMLYYKVAQMNAIQKDSVKSLDALKKAVSLHYDIKEILDIDFYNIRNDPGFIEAIR